MEQYCIGIRWQGLPDLYQKPRSDEGAEGEGEAECFVMQNWSLLRATVGQGEKASAEISPGAVDLLVKEVECLRAYVL